MCHNNDRDPRWGIVWTATAVGTWDSQPCPAIGGMQSSGFAYRLCSHSRHWEEEVDVLNCKSVAFDDLDSNAVSDDA